MRLILIRHGQTTSNIDGLIDTDEPGPGLTALGFAQAAALTDTLGGESIDVLYASPLVRARQTAAPLAASLQLDVRVRDGLREIGAGTLEMRDDDAAVQLYRDTTFTWSAGDVEVRMPGAAVVLEGSSRDGWHALAWDGLALDPGSEPCAGSSVRSHDPARSTY